MNSTYWLDDPAKGLVRSKRPPQVAMAQVVEKVLTDGGIAAIEAGTGTGKSYAYLIPALLSGKRVVVSTAKKNLQTQLYTKDLPLLVSKVKDAKYGLLKGRNNYGCKARLAEFMGGADRLRYEGVDAFAAWLEGHESGDLAARGESLSFEHHVRVTECVGAQCGFFGTCGFVRNKHRAAKASVVVVNHALLAYDLSVGGGKILGAYDALVIDEAHQAPRYFREAFTHRLHPLQPEHLRKLIEHDSRLRLSDEVDDTYVAIFQSMPDRPGRFTSNARLDGHFKNLQRQIEGLREQLTSLGAMPAEEGIRVETVTDEDPVADMQELQSRMRLTSAATNVKKLLKLLQVVRGQLPDDERARTPYVTFTERRGETLELQVTPVEVGPLVAPALLHIGRVVLTSATLAPANNFGWTAREFGLAEAQLTHKAAMPSPFNYAQLGALYVSPTAPMSDYENKADYHAKISVEVHELLAASRGGAFVLCASRDDMNGIYDNLIKQPGGAYRLAKQVNNVDVALEWFRKDPTSVLIGMKSLWEGVDVPGLHLRLTVIPRLPFPNRSDVVLAARKEQYVNRQLDGGALQKSAEMKAWADYDLQEALMELKQGGGRLIRTEIDKGIVALLDPRARGNAKNYSASVRACFPLSPTSDKKSVLEFLRRLAGLALTPPGGA